MKEMDSIAGDGRNTQMAVTKTKVPGITKDIDDFMREVVSPIQTRGNPRR